MLLSEMFHTMRIQRNLSFPRSWALGKYVAKLWYV